MMEITTVHHCRIKIVNDVTDHVTVVETERDGRKVYFDLARIVRRMNRRHDRTFAASLHVTADELVLHFHCPFWWGKPFAAESLAVADPIREIERAIWQTGGVA